jgi:hypothetical protein
LEPPIGDAGLSDAGSIEGANDRLPRILSFVHYRPMTEFGAIADIARPLEQGRQERSSGRRIPLALHGDFAHEIGETMASARDQINQFAAERHPERLRYAGA